MSKNLTKMSYTIEIDHQHHLIRYTHRGCLQVEDIGQAWDELVQIEAFTHQGYHLLSDYSKASFDFSIDNVGIIINILQQMPFLVGKKQAIITLDPYSTAGALIFENEVYNKIGFMVKTFSTLKAATHWIVDDD